MTLPETADGSDSRAAPRLDSAGVLLLGVLAAVWSWWAWQDGAYFETVWLPGAIVLCLVAALFVALVPSRAALGRRRSAIVAIAALAGLGIWSALSASWSPSPNVAITDGQRILVYALAFGLGLWSCQLLLGRNGMLALAPLAIAGAFAGAVAALGMAGAENARAYLDEGTLDFPLGYRNANAAFFMIAAFPALGLAADRGLDWRARGLALAATTMAVQLALLSQSRASVPAAVAALVVYVLLSPLRLRALSWLALALLPALGVLPALEALFAAINEGGPGRALGDLRDAGVVVLIMTGVSLALGLLAARFERRLPGLGSVSDRSNRLIAGGLGGLAAVLAVGFVVAVGNPATWIEDRIDEFRFAGSPDLSEESSRFTFNLGSDRYDLWRVALDDAADDPLLGNGGGGFQYSYLEKRDEIYQEARDAHSVGLEVLGELGIPGLLLLAAALAAALAAILRARRAGPTGLALSAIALASATYWLIHASVDWLWAYPAITATTFALLGAAAAPGLAPARGRPSPRARIALVAGLAALALTAIPIFLSERYINRAFDTWRSDLSGAYDDLDHASRLNPMSDTPALAEGAIARAAGDRERALAAFEEAVSDRPQEFAGHYLIAQLNARDEPGAAREQAAIALELNPNDGRVRSLARRLGLDPPPLP